ncbi:SH3 domain-containing protein [Acetobacter vaccinii]|uniref:SH3 domain-containing protein n=1 Tax=Acetobacter vaccinii TaxID=2592655 RepID=A0A5C1YK95_9PROT|nr:SH3 domain-containing protein [Acetobacter vaccinii]QEO16674.1 hypothetical protein FLP30_02005 [Acetobacter vaccinii]
MMSVHSSLYRFRLLSCVAVFLGVSAQVSLAHAAKAGAASSSHHHHHAHAAATHTAETSPQGGKTKKSKGKAAHGHAHADAAEHGGHGHASAGTAKRHRRHPLVAATAGAAVGAAAVAAATPATAAPPAAGTPAALPDMATGADMTKGSVSGLPLPRYAALRSDEVNMRAGPGRRFPILWVYHRQGLPVRIEREFDVWRLVEDQSGQKGWVQQATLSGGRYFLVPGEPPGDEAPIPTQSGQEGGHSTAGHMDSREMGYVFNQADALAIHGAVLMRSSGNDTAPIVAVLRPGTVGSIKECAAGTNWCKVSVHHYNGWVSRKEIWGVDEGEVISPS